MSKEEKQFISLTNAQCYDLTKEIELMGGMTNFLLSKKAIKVEENGLWTIMQYSGLVGCETGYGNYKYESEVPYIFWRRILDEVQKYEARKAYAKKKEEEHLEAIAGEVVQRPRNVN